MPVEIAVTLDPADPAIRADADDLAGRLDGNSDVERAVRLMLEDVAAGSRVLVLRADDEVTPAKAASIIGVTRQFVDRLCTDGVLPYRRLPGSTHRRIRVQDVVDVASERESLRAGSNALRKVICDARG